MIVVSTNVSVSLRHAVQKQACSLSTESVIEEGDSHDYKALACYHYRNTGVPPMIQQVYRARHVPTGAIVGAIVYSSPALNLGIRNKIFGNRYKIGGSTGTNTSAAGRLNKEMSLIIRVVVHPTFRGCGIGRRIIAETLPKRPHRFIEMSAAMGSVHPFAVAAGMKAYKVPRPENTERVLAALRSVGIEERDIVTASGLVTLVQALHVKSRTFISAEMIRYATRWIKSRTERDVTVTLEDAARRVVENCLLTTMYYLWENKPGREVAVQP